ncbi:hypothetical protein HII28_09025 [Planctomonas sp. JC2975]|uniref:hypothetical protein n=1 Tax=Planctomonas sp. JC2975 TaxID=2729626 RepID=UPI001473B898|nr:hypothetical protein [Planctomonas sp. JC2975]NNC12021.1 hypothetical protein [Planctomonas sp. JC2975]
MTKRNTALSALVWITVLGLGLGCLATFVGVLMVTGALEAASWVGPWLLGVGLGLFGFGLLASLFALVASAVVRAIEDAVAARRRAAAEHTATGRIAQP